MDLTHQSGREQVLELVKRIKPARKIQDLESFRQTLLDTEISDTAPNCMPLVVELEYLQSEIAYIISKQKHGRDISVRLDFLLERIYRLYKHPRIGGICTQVLESDFELVDELRSGTISNINEYLFQIKQDLFHLQLIYQTVVDSIASIEEDIEIYTIELDDGLTDNEKKAMIFPYDKSTRQALR